MVVYCINDERLMPGAKAKFSDRIGWRQGGRMAANSEYLTKDEFHREMKHYATKADLAQMETRLIKWIVGAMLASGGIAGTVMLVVQRVLE